MQIRKAPVERTPSKTGWDRWSVFATCQARRAFFIPILARAEQEKHSGMQRRRSEAA